MKTREEWKETVILGFWRSIIKEFFPKDYLIEIAKIYTMCSRSMCIHNILEFDNVCPKWIIQWLIQMIVLSNTITKSSQIIRFKIGHIGPISPNETCWYLIQMGSTQYHYRILTAIHNTIVWSTLNILNHENHKCLRSKICKFHLLYN